MSHLPLVLTFCSISTLSLSLWAKFSLRENRLSRILFPLALVYNFSLGGLHFYFFETGQIPTIGPVDAPIMAGLSLIMAFAYSYAVPWDWLSKPKSCSNRPNGTTNRISSIVPALEQLILFLKNTFIILTSAFFCSVMLIALVSQIIPLDAIEDTYYAIGCALLYVLLIGTGVFFARLQSRK